MRHTKRTRTTLTLEKAAVKAFISEAKLLGLDKSTFLKALIRTWAERSHEERARLVFGASDAIRSPLTVGGQSDLAAIQKPEESRSPREVAA